MLVLNAHQLIMNVFIVQPHFPPGVIGGVTCLLLIMMDRVVSLILQNIVESQLVMTILYVLYVRRDILFRMDNVVVVRMII